MNRQHERPNERPLHPRCPKLLSAEFKCLCEDLWEGWDGTDDGLDRRIVTERRLEARTGWGLPGTRGAGLDRDENEAHTPHYDNMRITSKMHDFTAERGFWKESENLKTIRAYDPDSRMIVSQASLDKLRLHIIDRGYWGNCEGADLDALRARVAKYQQVTV